MKTVLNYTDRNDEIIISGENPEIKINVVEEVAGTFVEPEIKFKENKFPDGSEIYIQSYSTAGYVGKPTFYGTVNKPINKRTIEPYASKDELYFRIKIIEKINDNKKKIRKVLSFKDKIKAAGSANVLQFGETDQIESIFELRMKPNEVPVVMFKKGLGLKSDLKTSNYLKGIIFTGCLREILLRYIFDSDNFSECDVRDDYVKHFKKLTNKNFPVKENEKDEIFEWLDLALERYSNYYVRKNKNLINIMPTNEIKIEDKLIYKS